MEIKPDFLNKAPIAKIRRQLLGNKDKPCGWPKAAILAAQRSPQKSEQRPVGKNGIFKWELGDSSCNPLTYFTPFSVQRLGTSSSHTARHFDYATETETQRVYYQ